MKQARKGITVVAAVAAFVGALALMKLDLFNPYILAASAMFAAVALGLIAGQWTRQ